MKIGGDVLMAAAWQVVCGEGTQPEKESLAEGVSGGREVTVTALDARADLLAFFIRGGELELAGALVDSRNVKADRSRVAALAPDLKTLAETGKLSPQLTLLSIPPKPPGPVRYNNCRAGAQDDLLGAADAGAENDVLPGEAEEEKAQL